MIPRVESDNGIITSSFHYTWNPIIKGNLCCPTVIPFPRYKLDQMFMLVLGFKLIAGAIASCAFIGVAIGVGLT